MKLITYYRSLTAAEKSMYAARAKTSTNYLKNHIMKPDGKPIKGASMAYMKKLSEASEDFVSLHEVVEHFMDRETYSGSTKPAA